MLRLGRTRIRCLARTRNRRLTRTRHFRRISKPGTNVLATSTSAMSESYCLRDPTLKRKLPHPCPVTSASTRRLRRSFKGRFQLGERLSHWNKSTPTCVDPSALNHCPGADTTYCILMTSAATPGYASYTRSHHRKCAQYSETSKFLSSYN